MLKSITFSNKEIINSIGMQKMFYNCRSLTSLDLSHFYTEKIKDMSEMFYNCASLTSLDISNFNTRNVVNMSKMFKGC